MELQSRFGTDERFRMDSRFLEDEDEEDNKAESGVATYLDFVWMCACVVELMMGLLLMELLTSINNGVVVSTWNETTEGLFLLNKATLSFLQHRKEKGHYGGRRGSGRWEDENPVHPAERPRKQPTNLQQQALQQGQDL